MRTRPYKVRIVTLGCPKNLVDSELLMRQIDAQGIEVVQDSEHSDARTVVLNTCGFIQDAKQESIDAILGLVKDKEEGRLDNLYVMGCLSQRYKTELQNEIPEVDRYFGLSDLREIIGQLGGNFREELIGERRLGTPSHYAYLKISEGCDRLCSFCAIPGIRGKQVSRPVEDLVREASWLVDSGVKEIILIAQDLTAYGSDLYGTRELPNLLEGISRVEGLQWIRLHYAYPAGFPEEVLYQIRDYPNLCHYLDIPLQHIADPVLSRMHRGIDGKECLELLEKIRETVPQAALRTTLMVGHPGEGEKEFEELKEFVKHARFERLGTFVYSEEEGTWGAENLKDKVPGKRKQSRLEEIMEIQQSISLEINKKREGEILKVLVDREEGDYFVGRTEYDSPEIDNEVLIQSSIGLSPGNFVDVHIKEGREFDLYGYAINP